MNRRIVLQIAHVVVAMFLAMPVVRGAGTLTPVSGPATAPLLIMVVADHYDSGDIEEFNADVNNFFKFGLLLDGYYKDHINDMRIMSYFDATPAGQDSMYGFSIAAGPGNCAVNTPDPSGTATKLKDTLNTVTGVPSRVQFVVLGNHPYDIGCTSGMWTYVAVDAVGTDVLPHEFGHAIAGLFDEWGLASNASTTYTGTIPTGDIRNCSTQTPPNWMTNLPSPPAKAYDNVDGCDLYNKGVKHPYTMCRMGASHHKEFCPVCANAMTTTFLDLNDPSRLDGPGGNGPMNLRVSHQPAIDRRPRFGIMNAAFLAQPVPPGKPLPPRRMARILVEFDPNPLKPRLTLKASTQFGTGTYSPSYRRTGNYLYEVVDNNGTREVGIINDQLLRPRGYRGAAGLHGTGEPGASEILIAIPDEDQASFADGSRNLTLVMYKIPPALDYATINKQRFREIKARLQPPLATLKLQ